MNVQLNLSFQVAINGILNKQLPGVDNSTGPPGRAQQLQEAADLNRQ